MAFILFNRKKVIPIAGGAETVLEPALIKIVAASETKLRTTNKKTILLEVLASGATAPYTYIIERNGAKVAEFSANSLNVAYEHALNPGDYTALVRDSTGLVSAAKSFTVQPEEADLTLLSIEQHGSLYFALDSGRGNLGPFKVNVWDQNGGWVTALSGDNPNPIRVDNNLPNGKYYFQIVDKYGFWSNIKPFTIEGSTSVVGSGVDVPGVELPSTDDFWDGLFSDGGRTSDGGLGADDELPDREGNVVGLKPVQSMGLYTDVDPAGIVENGRRIRREWGRTYWGHYFLNGVPHVDAQGYPLPFVDVSLPDNILVTLRVIYVDSNFEKKSYKLKDRIWETRTSQGGDDSYVFGANSVHITT